MVELMPTLVIVGSYRRDNSLAFTKQTFEAMGALDMPVIHPPGPVPIDRTISYVRFSNDPPGLSDIELQRLAFDAVVVQMWFLDHVRTSTLAERLALNLAMLLLFLLENVFILAIDPQALPTFSYS